MIKDDKEFPELIMIDDGRFAKERCKLTCGNDKDVQRNDNTCRFRCTGFTGIIGV